MATQPLSLQDSIAAWLQATRAQESVTPDFSVTTTPAEGLVDMAKPSQPKVDWTAMALQAAGNAKANADIQASLQAQQLAQATPWMNMGLRVAGTVGGGIAGIPLGPVGMAAGAATGAALMSNEVVQPREVAQGTREGVNPLVGMMEGYAAMPSGPALGGGALLPQLPRVAAGNFGLGVAGDALVQTAETGTVDPMRALQAGGMSAALGVAAPVAGRALMAAPRVATRVAQSPAVQRLMADETGAIRVHHASPHKFDKFDLSKVGTGEGAQAFGHGLYFAQNKDTANWYLKTFKEQHGKASLYEADINVDESQLVDWDKPMADQSPEIAAATRRVLDSRYGEGVFDEWSSNGADYKDLLDNFDDIDGPELSKLLKEAGVPGIKYLDRDSRYGGSDTRNIVVFDDSLVSVLSRSDFPIGRAVVPLNKDLQGAKPRFNIGTASFQPEFASPVDLAAYIVTQKNPSKRDADYLAYAMQQTGLDADGVRALGQQVRAAVKAQAEQAQGGTSKKPAAVKVASVWQDPNATPSARAPIGSPSPEPDIPLTTGLAEPAVPSRIPEDIRRHEDRLRRMGRDEDEIAESVFFQRHIMDDVFSQGQREIIKPNAKTIEEAKQLLADGHFEMPTGKASKMKFSETDAAAVAYEYASREEFLSRLRERMGPDLRTRFNRGDADAVESVQALSQAYGVQGIDGLERLKYEAGLQAMEAAIADKSIGTAQGRGLQLRQARLSLKDVPDAEFLRVAGERGLPPQQALDLLDQVAGTPGERIAALRKLATPSFQDYWRQIVYTSLLSNPATHGVNFLGTTASIIAREAMSQTVVAGVDRLKGGARTMAAAPLDLQAKAYWGGMKMGFRTGMLFLRQGYDPNSLAAQMDVPIEAFTGKVTGPVMQAPTRLLAAADAFMAQIPYWGEVMRRVTAQAKNEGLEGQALRDRIEFLAKNHEADEDLVKHVNNYVKTALFKNDPGQFTNWATQGVRLADKFGKEKVGGVPIGTLLLPFRSTPAAILRQGFKAAGGGVITGARAAKQGDSVQATRDIAEAVVGLGLMATLVMDVADGTIEVVGELPENSFERESAYAQGQKPWSIKVAGRTIPATTLGPLSTPIAIAGAYVQSLQRDPKKPMEPFSRYIAPAMRMVFDSTMLKGMSDFIEGIREQDAGEKLTGRMVTMNIPYAGGLRYVRDQMDPILRDPGGAGANARFLSDGDPQGALERVQAGARNVQEEVEAALPGLSTRVRPKFDAFGAPIQRPISTERVTGTPERDDPVRQELIRLRKALPSWDDDALYPGDMNAALTSLEGQIKKEAQTENFMFSDRERSTYKVVVGGLIGQTLAAVVAHPKYAAMSDIDKAKVIRDERNRARREGVAMFKELVGETVAPRLRARQ